VLLNCTGGAARHFEWFCGRAFAGEHLVSIRFGNANGATPRRCHCQRCLQQSAYEARRATHNPGCADGPARRHCTGGRHRRVPSCGCACCRSHECGHNCSCSPVSTRPSACRAADESDVTTHDGALGPDAFLMVSVWLAWWTLSFGGARLTAWSTSSVSYSRRLHALEQWERDATRRGGGLTRPGILFRRA
jgi:hypothetical protein